jgi:hypothetical protein
MNDICQNDEKRIDDRGCFDDGWGDFIARKMKRETGNRRNKETEKRGNGEK